MYRALLAVARGSSLQKAARDTPAPYASLHKSWKGLGGDVDSPSWQAFKLALPPLPPTPEVETAPSPADSPLGPRLKRKADRHGDAVPYGCKGPRGMYREGTKEMTSKIANGVISPEEASSQLAAVGVKVAAATLERRARDAPGKSPDKGGRKLKLKVLTEKTLHDEIAFMRQHDITVTKSMIIAMATAKILETGESHVFKDGTPTDDWYYGYLDRYDMSSDDTKPLESDRDLWLTSKNAEKQYAVWAGIAVRNGMAELNPDFDPDKPYDEMIIWYPSALPRLLSMDETDVRNDQTKCGHAQARAPPWHRTLRACQGPAQRARACSV